MSCGNLTLLAFGAWLLGASFTCWMRKRQARRVMEQAAALWGDRLISCDVRMNPWWAWPFAGHVEIHAIIEEQGGEIVTVVRVEDR